jgi:hypothetical protein
MNFSSQEVEERVFDKTKIIKANDKVYKAVKNLVDEGLASGMSPGSPELSVAVRIQVESAVMRCLDEAIIKNYDSKTIKLKTKTSRLLEEIQFGDSKYTRIDLISKIIDGVKHNLPLDDLVVAKGFYLYLQELKTFYLSINLDNNKLFVGNTVEIEFYDKKVRLSSVIGELAPDVAEAKTIFPLIVDYINEAINLRDEVVINPINKQTLTFCKAELKHENW